jgi:hypothetical protein
MNVIVHIERLVLDGLPVTSAQLPLLEAAVEAELVRRLVDGDLVMGIPPGGALSRAAASGQGLFVPQLAPGTIHLRTPADARALGGQIAQAVHTGLTHD